MNYGSEQQKTISTEAIVEQWSNIALIHAQHNARFKKQSNQDEHKNKKDTNNEQSER